MAGQFVQVSMQLSDEPHAIVVPSVAVQTGQQGQYVYVVKADRTVELRHVTVDRQQGDDDRDRGRSEGRRRSRHRRPAAPGAGGAA